LALTLLFLLHNLSENEVLIRRILPEKFANRYFILYLCKTFLDALQMKASAQQSSNKFDSAFALHFTCSWKMGIMDNEEKHHEKPAETIYYLTF
jgi:hypothetical protein